MKVRELVEMAARLLGILDGVVAYFDDDERTLEHESELLVNCFNMVESMVALDYLPLYAEDELRTATGQLEFSSFTYAPVRILKVTDTDGNSLPYTLTPKYIKTQTGIVKVTYAYTPNKKNIGGESDFALMGAKHLFVYGMLAEFCLAEGRFEEASAWDKKFKESIECVFHTRACQRLSSRRWV